MRCRVFLRFYEELNEFLPHDRKKRRFELSLKSKTPVAKLLEQLGIPRSRVDLALRNGKSIPFSYIAQDGDYLSFFPVFESFDVTSLQRLRPRSLRRTRFIVGPRLRRLASYLASLGFDIRSGENYHAEEILAIAEKERRIFLTKDEALLRHPNASRAYLVRKRRPREQLLEVLGRFELRRSNRARIVGRRLRTDQRSSAREGARAKTL